MKNIELLSLDKTVVEEFSEAQLFAQTANKTYFLSKNILYKHIFDADTVIELCPIEFKGATHLKVLNIENKLCIVTLNSIHIYDLNEDNENEVTTITFEHDIAAISWNPTEEIVAIVSQNGNVATYSINYETAEIFPQGESSVSAKIPDTVYVGWGSKETQFRGSEGKIKKQPQSEIKAVEDKKPTISWRGNGEMFVVNYWVDEKRKFIIFETPCKALHKSEECLGLQGPVSWKPEGNMIAAVTEVSRQCVTIFEKNGQKRFDLIDFEKEVVVELQWSPCGKILTVLTENLVTKIKNLRLLTASNYKWYEKQTLTFYGENPVLNFHWLESTQFTFNLCVITRKNVVKYTFKSVICTSMGQCAVIDGTVVHLTDFNDCVIPPIMSLRRINNKFPINFVMFFYNEFLATVDSESKVRVYNLDDLVRIYILDLKNSCKSDDLLQIPLAFHHFILEKLQINFFIETRQTAIYTAFLGNSKSAPVYKPVGILRHFKKVPISCEIPALNEVFPNLYVNNELCKAIGLEVRYIDDDVYTCQLLSNCHFYVNDVKINEFVNSFYVFDRYLLYTTKMNEIFCLRLDKKPITGDNYKRNIEQGATIVTAVLGTPRIVLQIPRGNLETISCRFISVDILDRLLSDGDWEYALFFMRLEKLNANLLFDLNPKRFLEQVDRFIDGAKTLNELNSLVLEFEEGNVLSTVCKHWGKTEDFPGKINAIFREIINYFDKVDYVDFITTIMIININFFSVHDALIYLQDLLRRSVDDANAKQKLISAVRTLKNYGCDQEKLYTESLLLYDLNLARFVATCTQLDPRTYEEQLNNLKNLTEVERRYEINVYGKRHKSAIAYLLRCKNANDETVANFLKNHNVCQEAYETCPKNNRFYQTVSRVFAQDLSRRGCHQEAGIVFKRAGLLEEALKQFKLCLKWREVLNILEEMKVDEVSRLQTVNQMALKLIENRKIQGAAILYEFYARNYEMAVKVYLDNYRFEDAVHLAKKYNRADIIVSEVIPLLMQHKIYLEEKLNDLYSMFEMYKLRLKEVRKNNADKANNYDLDDRGDLFSEGGSTISRTSRSSKKSRSSTNSSRYRRKLAKKKQDLREGGVFEDIALIRALHCTIKEIYSKAEETRTCCLLLVQESDIEYHEVKELYKLFCMIDQNIKDGVGEIWPPHFHANNPTQNLQEIADLENFDNLDVEYRTPPSTHTTWRLNMF